MHPRGPLPSYLRAPLDLRPGNQPILDHDEAELAHMATGEPLQLRLGPHRAESARDERGRHTVEHLHVQDV